MTQYSWSFKGPFKSYAESADTSGIVRGLSVTAVVIYFPIIGCDKQWVMSIYFVIRWSLDSFEGKMAVEYLIYI